MADSPAPTDDFVAGISILKDMGFPEGVAVATLAYCNGSLPHALDMLLTGESVPLEDSGSSEFQDGKRSQAQQRLSSPNRQF
jgi:hypothetical protein